MIRRVIDENPSKQDETLRFSEIWRKTDFDAVRIRGYVRMISVESDGTQKVHFEGENLVVNNAREALAHLIAYAGSEYKISRARFGNCSYLNDQIVNPLPASIDDLALQDDPAHQIECSGADFVVDSVEYDESLQAWVTTFAVTLDGDRPDIDYGIDGYKTLTEMGLFFSALDPLHPELGLYARKTYPSYVLADGRKLIVYWSLVFVS